MEAGAVRERANDLPREPGVYLFESADDVLYVGKAVDLRSRVRSYADPRSQRIRRMIGAADGVDFAVTDTETQALLLEANLIKRHQPRYNVRLKDDKSYPLVQLTDHEVPRIEVTRDPEDGATVFGPFTEKGRVETVVKALRETYGIRACSDHKYANRDRPCLDYEMGLCTAPCTGEIAVADYREDVESVVRFLEGETGVLAEPLRRGMEAAAERRAYERAASLRDRLDAVEAFHEGGGAAVVGRDEEVVDVLGVAVEGDSAIVARLHSEDGKLVDRERHRVDVPAGSNGSAESAGSAGSTGAAESAGSAETTGAAGAAETTGAAGAAETTGGAGSAGDMAGGEGEWDAGEDETAPDGETPHEEGRVAAVLAAFVPQFYADRRLPDALLLPERHGDPEVDRWLEAEGVAVRVPGAGREATLVELALKNARRRAGEADATGALARRLGIDRPERVEGFDVSHAQGRAVVGSNVTFDDGAPAKRGYRRKKLRETNDDYANMRELVRWRALRALEGRDDRRDPDLLVIDGGEGQLGAARDALAETGWDVPAIALAKDRELVVTPDGVFDWPDDDPALHLLQRVRDEAHRFAVQYHQTVRDEVSTPLDDVSGVGPELRKRLLRRFGSVDGVRAASPDELTEVSGVGEATADAIDRAL